MTQTKGKVPLVTAQTKDTDGTKEFKGTVSKHPAKDSGARGPSKTVATSYAKPAQKGPTLRGRK